MELDAMSLLNVTEANKWLKIAASCVYGHKYGLKLVTLAFGNVRRAFICRVVITFVRTV